MTSRRLLGPEVDALFKQHRLIAELAAEQALLGQDVLQTCWPGRHS